MDRFTFTQNQTDPFYLIIEYISLAETGVKLGRSPPEPGSPTYDLGSATCNRSSTISKEGSGT